MVIDKNPSPDEFSPTDNNAPPSYTVAVSPDTSSPSSYRSDEKSVAPRPVTSPSPSSSSSTPPPRNSVISRRPTTTSTSPLQQWFNSSTSRTTSEVRNTVHGLVRDLVRERNMNSAASRGILESCAHACSDYAISLSSLLQEKFIEDHTPLYWAIVKRPLDGNARENLSESGGDLLTTLLAFSKPLDSSTLSDIRLACLVTSDQSLFQRLRSTGELSPLSGTDEMILRDGAGIGAADEIVVENVPGDEGSFAVDFKIPRFQKRMQISKRVSLEFIARARMWCLEFSIIPEGARRVRAAGDVHPGSWIVTLSLVESSPSTWIDARLLVSEPEPSLRNPHALIDSPISDATGRPKPTITLRLQSKEQLHSPGARRHPHRVYDKIVVPLEDSLMGKSLQYAGSSYIASDETLRARLEARLTKPGPECIIC